MSPILRFGTHRRIKVEKLLLYGTNPQNWYCELIADMAITHQTYRPSTFLFYMSLKSCPDSVIFILKEIFWSFFFISKFRFYYSKYRLVYYLTINLNLISIKIMNKKWKQHRLYWRNLFYKSIILIEIKLSLNVENSSKLFLRILRIIH